MAAVTATTQRIAASPLQFPEVCSGWRRALLPRFPFGIYFAEEGARVVVHAVLHLHREPSVWRRRLPPA